ncbi:DNA-binding transcriptional LysR family regulator [Lipingzhangella halophila]|uniref:DNA-binding transcriptional LysR family regulator n=1 Tax=Lipingzhangella halophila TaxID=1783352 RepID=A0A7W7W158_9ACTN|nr:LysR family transcriptional regulator [Lipingzhangella halophila]MBB4930301.1 DNA-binding transcriptional LysR family regulator [Lipingzhangella halophila]
MTQADTRELRCFVAVAEELHFGRAAARLGIAQPPLTRTIQKLERRMGVRLLDRGGRGVELTEAGAVLLYEGRKALEGVAAATRRAQRAGRTPSTLVLAMKPGGDGGLLAEILAAHAAEPDATEVDIDCVDVGEQAAAVRDGRADIALLHRPNADLTGLDSEDLLVESQVALLPPHHRLAGRARIRESDLAVDPLPRWPDAAGELNSPAIREAGRLMQLISVGRLVAVGPESVRQYAWGGVACVPVVDAAPITLALAWPEDARSRAVSLFVRVATTVAPRNRDAMLHEPEPGI